MDYKPIDRSKSHKSVEKHQKTIPNSMSKKFIEFCIG